MTRRAQSQAASLVTVLADMGTLLAALSESAALTRGQRMDLDTVLDLHRVATGLAADLAKPDPVRAVDWRTGWPTTDTSTAPEETP